MTCAGGGRQGQNQHTDGWPCRPLMLCSRLEDVLLRRCPRRISWSCSIRPVIVHSLRLADATRAILNVYDRRRLSKPRSTRDVLLARLPAAARRKTTLRNGERQVAILPSSLPTASWAVSLTAIGFKASGNFSVFDAKPSLTLPEEELGGTIGWDREGQGRGISSAVWWGYSGANNRYFQCQTNGRMRGTVLYMRCPRRRTQVFGGILKAHLATGRTNASRERHSSGKAHCKHPCFLVYKGIIVPDDV